MRPVRYILIIICLGLVVSCIKPEKPHSDEINHTLIITLLGHNNLSRYMSENLDSLNKGILPLKNSDKAIVVYSHQLSENSSRYDDGAAPVLFKVYRENGKVVYDTLIVYHGLLNSASATAINTALNDIQRLVPSSSYGMVFSSHATAWLPHNYPTTSVLYEPFSIKKDNFDDNYNYGFPLTKTIGAYYYRSGSQNYTSEMDISDFVKAVPMHLKYFISDACLMSSIEVIWEFKDICDYYIASPTEVLAEGFVYKTLPYNIFKGDEPDLVQIAKDYFDFYDNQTGTYRSATIAMVDCKKLDNVASSFSKIVSNRTDDLFYYFDNETVQKYFYNPSRLCFYYDIYDFAQKFASSKEDIAALGDALNEAIVYHAETPQFFENSLNFENCCGISVYLPRLTRPDLNEYYPSLPWSKATGYLQ